MSHHLKSGGKKQRLAFTLVGKPRHFACGLCRTCGQLTAQNAPQKPPPIIKATATPIIFPQYCIDSPNLYALSQAMSHNIRCFYRFTAAVNCGTSPIICIIIPVIQCRA
jgi:hypothetical protein